MAGSVNKVILVGNLGRDPEVRYTQNNQKIVNLRIATSERWKDRQSGEPRERTEWHSVVIFNENLGRVAEQYLKKGSKVYLEGQLQTRKWTDQSGAEKYTTEVVLQRFRGELTILDSRGGGSAVCQPNFRPASLCPASRGSRRRLDAGRLHGGHAPVRPPDGPDRNAVPGDPGPQARRHAPDRELP